MIFLSVVIVAIFIVAYKLTNRVIGTEAAIGKDFTLMHFLGQ